MRTTETLTREWRFRKFATADQAEMGCFALEFDDSAWETVRVPHDWAIGGEFDPLNDATYQKVDADGIKNKIKHTGRSGALPLVGFGVYRRSLFLDESLRGQRVFLEFDGVMWESVIYLNGIRVGENHFGYGSFEVEITDHVRFGERNLLSVSAELLTDCSRWYSGAGLFRNVRLVTKHPTHIKKDGVWLRQLEANAQNAAFLLEIEYEGNSGVTFQADIYTPAGERLTSLSHGVVWDELSDIFVIENPQLWDIDAPVLYRADVTLFDENGTEVDTLSIPFGPRNVRFTAEEGFFLNGRKVKLHGVCNHHDQGSLGAAVSIPAIRRQLQLMREMGVNAIRTSHNPPSPELLQLCDELGFVVMDEFFDEWKGPKVAHGYAQYFDAHAEGDAIRCIKRDRNHPSVILWSIGNEIREQNEDDGWRVAKYLTDIVHRTDPTRLVAAGCDQYPNAIAKHLAQFVDVVGFNYKPHRYKEVHEAHPDMILVGSETESCVSTRGIYHLPAQAEIPVQVREDLTISAYEMCAPAWAYYAERELAWQEDCPFVAGEFIWTGFDYLGEPTPYYVQWPSRSSYFGVIDLAGLPKNRFYLYRANWTNHPVLHVFPHWNWEGYEGQCVPVHVYTNYPEAELFVNGVSQGRRTFTAENEFTRFRLMWNEVIYTPGELRVVAYDAAGRAVQEEIIRTAKAPHHIELVPERTSITADENDLVYVTARIVDEDGNLCPHAADRITFSVSGAGEFLTTDAGDQREVEPFTRPDKKALAGLLVACIRSTECAGDIVIRAAAEGLISGETIVQSK